MLEKRRRLNDKGEKGGLNELLLLLYLSIHPPTHPPLQITHALLAVALQATPTQASSGAHPPTHPLTSPPPLAHSSAFEPP